MRDLLVMVALFMFIGGQAWAQNTSVGFNVSRGESSSTAYSLYLHQRYAPLIGGDMADLSPTMDLAGHYWTRKSDDVWGASFAPGLLFTMYTDANFNPFVGASVGGIILSENELGPRDFGSNLLFRTKGVLGFEFGEGLRHRLQGEYNNYSTWGITNTDDGYSTVGASYSFAF